jgi:hypothetical protein
MGMLLTHHEGYWPEGKAPKATKRSRPRRHKVVGETPAEVVPAEDASPYAELTDEQVAEAYATNVGEDAEGREAQVAALEALDAEANPAE